MKYLIIKLNAFFIFILFSTSLIGQCIKPISLHPENPHYFLFKNKPTILITSAEHYGAVVNLDFDYLKYLDELKANGLNYTRLFSGTYIEIPGSFNISDNTLAPKQGSYICPWARSNVPGYNGGGNKFDLDKWDETYFERLRNFISEAGKRGIVVEMTLFTALYRDEGWTSSPMNGINNINNINTAARNDAHTLHNGSLLKYQETLVKKIVSELSKFDNVFFEIQNEPWAGGNGVEVLTFEKDKETKEYEKHLIVRLADQKSLEWQKHITSIIVAEEADNKNKHLIAQNFTNFKHQLQIQDVHPAISILNFHYALASAAKENYGLNKVIGFDETGFSGNKDETYRRQAWRFIMSGGGLFNNLDYSFTTDSPDGTEVQKAPGGGSRTLRNQLKVLKNFIESFDFIKMKPVINVEPKNEAYQIYELSNPDKAYAFYFEGVEPQENISIELPEGNYQIELISVEDGRIKSLGRKKHQGGMLKLDTSGIPDFALRIKNV